MAARDILIAKLSSTGQFINSIVRGGEAEDIGRAIALDANHNLWITGTTYSKAIGATPPSKLAGHQDAFIMKMSNALQPLLFQYLGGSGDDAGFGITVDANNAVWVAGGTCSPDFPRLTSKPYPATGCASFVARYVNDNLDFSTTFGGSAVGDSASAIVSDRQGKVYVTGYTSNPNFPVTPGAFQTHPASGGAQGFVAALDDTGEIVFSTFLGDSGNTYPTSVALDTSRDVFVAGSTTATDFPGFAPNAPSGTNGFVARLSRSLATFVHGEYLGLNLHGVAVQPPIFGLSTAFVVAGDATDPLGAEAYVGKLNENSVRDSILWHSPSTGELRTWNLNHGYAVTGTQTIAPQCGPAQGCPDPLHVVGTGDFDSDGVGDILLHNVSTGDVLLWLLKPDGSLKSQQTLDVKCGVADGCSTMWSPVAGRFR
jgi:hypothetical protein